MITSKKKLSNIRHCLHRKLSSFICFFIIALAANGQEGIVITDSIIPYNIGKNVELFVDSTGIIDTSTITGQQGFRQSEKNVIGFAIPVKSLWIRFRIENLSRQEQLFLSLKYSNIAKVFFYKTDAANNLVSLKQTGNNYPFYSRGNGNVDFNFQIATPVNQSATYYINIRSNHPLELPLTINSDASLNENNSKQGLIIGIYCGIIISILLYNLFVSFATNDRSYFIYILYLFALGFAQLTFAGWSFKLFWPSFPALNHYMVVLTSCFAGAMGITFARSFLHAERYAPRIGKFLYVLLAVYAIAILVSFSSYSPISYVILNYNNLTGGVVLLILPILVFRKGYRTAYFYLLAWSFFLSAIIIYTLKNLEVLPTNNFTHYVLYYGSAIEVILLSFALADKINIYKKEKELSQAEALRVSVENETLIKEQNVMLERKVHERTTELQSANEQLNNALDELKDAQIQLVEAEKMASLGQLTAGIAHEINNPINFVKSNIKPLNLDVDDLFDVIGMYEKLHGTDIKNIPAILEKVNDKKEELDIDFVKKEIRQLIKGIEEGAERTAEIVRGLRTFSRLDESELKVANVHDGLNSTLVLLRNGMPAYLRIAKSFEAKGNIECFPGKLNQVFMNIINNSIQAIEEKKEKEEEEYLTLSTMDIPGDKIQIRIKDSGVGMTEQVKHKIFEPFFTTKSVGVGTGLGMAIVFKIIEEHRGKIELESEPGKGAEFILTLPCVHPVK